MSRLFKITFRAFLLPEGFRSPATIVTVADTSEEAISIAFRWFQRNQPYYVSENDFRTASLNRFEAVELAYFVCYGMEEKPLQWDFPDWANDIH